jgi:hypothetical protein
MFFHVKLHPDARKYFGFAVPDADGVMKYYQFTVLVYGFKSAVQVVTRLILPLKALIHRLGIRFSIYIDDGRVLGQTAVETEQKSKVVLEIFNWQGGQFSGKKR